MGRTKQRLGQDGKPKSPWAKTPTPNLVKYVPAGSYYLRARIGGGIVRESLRTKNYDVARYKLQERLRELRMTSPKSRSNEAPVTLEDALQYVRAAVVNDPALKENTRRSYLEELTRLMPGKGAAVPLTALSRLTDKEMASWWKGVADKYAAQKANHSLMWVRRALKLARKMGSLIGDPTEDLKRIKVPRTRLKILTSEQFVQLVLSVRGMKKANSEQAADWIEFQTYSGLRPGELKALLWEHIDTERGVIWVHGGIEGTKNRESRPVPMIPAMIELVERMRGGQSRVGKVFTLTGPRDALRNACERLGLAHMRIYDLRHTFATLCNESGVDVPTFAKWLGHKDGGALAMRTYVHGRDEHSQRSAAKVKF